MAKLFTLEKNERLKSRKIIEQLFSNGKKFVITPFRVFYTYCNNEKYALQFGAGVSSKNFKKAVDRNRVKRVMRETYRLQKNNLQEKLKQQNSELHLFIIYTNKELPDYKEAYIKMGMVIDKLIILTGAAK